MSVKFFLKKIVFCVLRSLSKKAHPISVNNAISVKKGGKIIQNGGKIVINQK